MTARYHQTRSLVTGGIVILLMLTSCTTPQTISPPAATILPATLIANTPSSPTLPPALETGVPASVAPTIDTAGLSPDEAKTLSSLQRIDDFPLYVMYYYGGYEYPQLGATTAGIPHFGCSIFAALSSTGDKLYGRNFDWDYSPTLILFTDPPDGYASASMLDVSWLDIPTEAIKNLADLPVNERKALLSAPSLPLDGMNEYGLVVGMAAVEDEYIDDTSYDPNRPTIDPLGIIRQVLDHARSVDEAVALFEQYNISFAGALPIHYLIADPSGKAVLIEFYQGEMKVLPNENPWHMATNHLRCIAQGDGGCQRYHTLAAELARAGGSLDEETAMRLLLLVRQTSTQRSVVYNLSSGNMQVMVGADFATTHSFHLDLLSR